MNNNGASTNIGQQQNYNGYGYYGREARMNDPGFNIKGNQEINGDIGQQGDIKNQAGPVNNNGASTNVGQQHNYNGYGYYGREVRVNDPGFDIGGDQKITGNIGQQGDIKNQAGPVNNNGASTNVGQQQNYNGYGYYGREVRVNDPGFDIGGNQKITGNIGQQGDIENQAGPVNNNGASTNVGQQQNYNGYGYYGREAREYQGGGK